MTEVPVYRNQCIDLQSKLLDFFLYDRELRHDRVKKLLTDHFIWWYSNILIVWFNLDLKISCHLLLFFIYWTPCSINVSFFLALQKGFSSYASLQILCSTVEVYILLSITDTTSWSKKGTHQLSHGYSFKFWFLFF